MRPLLWLVLASTLVSIYLCCRCCCCSCLTLNSFAFLFYFPLCFFSAIFMQKFYAIWLCGRGWSVAVVSSFYFYSLAFDFRFRFKFSTFDALCGYTCIYRCAHTYIGVAIMQMTLASVWRLSHCCWPLPSASLTLFTFTRWQTQRNKFVKRLMWANDIRSTWPCRAAAPSNPDEYLSQAHSRSFHFNKFAFRFRVCSWFTYVNVIKISFGLISLGPSTLRNTDCHDQCCHLVKYTVISCDILLNYH